MANRPQGYGFTADLAGKIDAKYDTTSEQQAREWMEAVVGEPLVPGADAGKPLGMDAFAEALKDGTYLCKLMNIIKPGSISKVHPSTSNAFKFMENIAQFLTACENYGCARGDLFQSVYLTDKQNVGAVVGGIHALGRRAQLNGFTGPTLGPKEAEANPREFTEEQLLAGRVHGI